jgi:hypothetical protein
VDVNTIANRTLISDETNGRIKDKAPAVYLRDPSIFPSGARLDLLGPHFIDDTTLPMLLAALEELPDAESAALYGRFLQAREAAMIEEIRRACGISTSPTTGAEDTEPDDVAADIKAGASLAEDTANELELDTV